MKKTIDYTIRYWALVNHNHITIRDILWAIPFLFGINFIKDENGRVKDDDYADYILISPEMYSYIEDCILEYRNYKKRLTKNLNSIVRLFDLIYMDTNFIVHCFDNGYSLIDRIIDIANQYGKRIIITSKTLEELDDIMKKNNEKRFMDSIRYISSQIQLKKIKVENYTSNIPDQFFAEIAVKERPYHSVLVLTDDKDCITSIDTYNHKQKSSRGYLIGNIRSHYIFDDFDSREADLDYTAYLRNPYCLRCGKKITEYEVVNHAGFCQYCFSKFTNKITFNCRRDGCKNEITYNGMQLESWFLQEDLSQSVKESVVPQYCAKCRGDKK